MNLDPEWAAGRRRIEDSRYFIGPTGVRPLWKKATFTRLLDVFAWGVRLMPLHARGQRNALDVRRVEFDIEVAGLPPAFDGYRILRVSDTHLDVLPALAEVAHRLLDGTEVDLLALTGDVHCKHHAPVSRSAELLMQALRGVRVRGPRLAILGNHDRRSITAPLPRLLFKVSSSA